MRISWLNRQRVDRVQEGVAAAYLYHHRAGVVPRRDLPDVHPLEFKEERVGGDEIDVGRKSGLRDDLLPDVAREHVSPGLVAVITHLQVAEADFDGALLGRQELFGKEFKTLYPETEPEGGVRTPGKFQMGRYLGVLQPVFHGVIIVLGQPDQGPDKRGKHKADDEDRELVPEFIAPPLPGIPDQFKKIRFQPLIL